MALTQPQAEAANHTARFRCLVAGRRFGKTHLAIREVGRFARVPNARVWYVAPTYRMARDIAWTMLKEKLESARWVRKFNESRLTAELRNGSIISLKGADNPDSLRGVGLDFVILDEYADIKSDAWHKVLRPTLSDSQGHALFIGTPRGRNWAYDLWQQGRQGVEDWASWQFTTLQGGQVSPEEVESARRDLDELTFAQEYEASFVNFEGRAYYPFMEADHCASLPYDPAQPLILCFDFNVAPGVAAIAQEMKLPNGFEGTGVIGEGWIPRNSNTPAVCRKLAQDWSSHSGPVHIYGDATGGARGTAKVQGSDWDLVRTELRSAFAGGLNYQIASSNPPERGRINAVNSRLKNKDGMVRLQVDPAKAPHIVRDLEGVQLLSGGAGEIDKKADPDLTHISDALGYYIERAFPVKPRIIREQKILGV